MVKPLRACYHATAFCTDVEIPHAQGRGRTQTKETSIEVGLDLDGSGASDISTGVGFFDHMLDQLARHSLIDMTIHAKGDLHIDDHHTVEDVGIALGQAFAKALGDKQGLTRYADCLLPMDETLTRVAVDVSGRPFLVFRTEFPTERIGTFDAQLVREFFQAFAGNAGLTLHIDTLYGLNSHHIAESCFKGVARALKAAVAIDPRQAERVPSTKGASGACHDRRHHRLRLRQPAFGAKGVRARRARGQASGRRMQVTSRPEDVHRRGTTWCCRASAPSPTAGAGSIRWPAWSRRLEEAVRRRGKPFFGICVGAQLLATRGLEHEAVDGPRTGFPATSRRSGRAIRGSKFPTWAGTRST